VSIAIDGPDRRARHRGGRHSLDRNPRKHAKILEQELKEEITADEREALAAYLETKRKRDPFWGSESRIIGVLGRKDAAVRC